MDVQGPFESNIDWSPWLAVAPRQVTPAGTKLLQQDEVPAAVYFVETGIVKVVYESADGTEAILALRSGRWPLGGAAVLLDWKLPCSVTTVTSCKIAHLRRAEFEELEARDPAICRAMVRAYSHELFEQMLELIDLRAQGPVSRLRRALWRIATASGEHAPGGPEKFHLPFNQYELAQLVGLSPEHLSKLMHGMRESGELSKRKGWLTLRAPGP